MGPRKYDDIIEEIAALRREIEINGRLDTPAVTVIKMLSLMQELAEKARPSEALNNG